MNDLSPPVLRRERAEIIQSPFLELRSNMNALRRYHTCLQTRPLTYEENEIVFLLMARRLELEEEIRVMQEWFRSFTIN
jgi:hypothetical protein